MRLEVRQSDPSEVSGSVSGYIDAGMGQTVLAVHSPGRPDGSVLGLYGRLVVPREQANLESLVASLVQKYGEPTARLEDKPFRLTWGAASMADECGTFPEWYGRLPPIRLADPPDAGHESQLAMLGFDRAHIRRLAQRDSGAAPRAGGDGRLQPHDRRLHRQSPSGGCSLSVWLIDMAALMRAPSDSSLAGPADIKL